MNKRRYNNYTDPTMIAGLIGADVAVQQYNSGLLATGTTGKVSDWSAQNTVDVINTGSNLIQNVLTSIFGRNNTQMANAYNTLYQQEQRTNTILWVVIGLVVALGVFLVIRKTK